MRHNWRTIQFNDESRFTIKFSDGGLRVWRPPGESYSDGAVMQVDRFGGGSLIVSGGFHFRGKTNLVVVRQKMNAQRYCIDILRPVVIPFMNGHYGFVFQQDNARPHTARLTANVLQTNNVNTLP